MNTPRRAKYCPRCRTMTTLEAAKCLYCGHEFSTSVSGSLLTEEMLNKTQMFNLPPALPRVETEPPPVIRDPATREDSGGLMLRVVLSLILGLIVAALIALWWRQL
jgi:hypothetical protein